MHDGGWSTRTMRVEEPHQGSSDSLPPLNINLQVIPTQPKRLLAKLHERSIDIGLTLYSPFREDDGLTHSPVTRTPLFATMSTAHPLAESASLVPEQLSSQRIVLIDGEHELEHHVNSLFRLHNLRMGDVRYTEHVDTLPFTLEDCQGIFIGAWPLIVVPDVSLVSIPVANRDFFCEMGFLYQHDCDNPAVTALLDCASRLHCAEKI